MAHKDIRIPFTVGGRNFEAVGFLDEVGNSVTGDNEILARTATDNGGAIGDEDEEFLRQHRDELPAKLKPYWLMTNRRGNGSSRYVSCLYFSGWQWREHVLFWINDQRHGDYLVVRRCP